MNQKEKNNYLKQSKGITLVALVVTIIILIILAGVSISLVLGDNGIVSKAKDAKQNMQVAANEEQQGLANLEVAIQEGVNGGDEGTTPYFPSSNFSQVAGTSLDNGLVIQDNEGNEYVWIEVPNDGTGPNYSSVSSSEDYDNIATALKNYVSAYRFSGYEDEPDSTLGISDEEYYLMYNAMLKSVYEHGGFYIGRYEAGSEVNNRSYDWVDPWDIPQSKPGLWPMQTNSTSGILKVIEQMDDLGDDYDYGMIFGIQWDLIMKYLEVNGTPNSELTEDSNWGNIEGNIVTVTSLDNYISFNSGSSSSSSSSSSSGSGSSAVLGSQITMDGTILKTGSFEQFKKMNIYDLLGNVMECTLAISQSDVGYCPLVFRGDDINGFARTPGAAGYASGYQNICNGVLGFRIAIY